MLRKPLVWKGMEHGKHTTKRDTHVWLSFWKTSLKRGVLLALVIDMSMLTFQHVCCCLLVVQCYCWWDLEFARQSDSMWRLTEMTNDCWESHWCEIACNMESILQKEIHIVTFCWKISLYRGVLFALVIDMSMLTFQHVCCCLLVVQCYCWWDLEFARQSDSMWRLTEMTNDCWESHWCGKAWNMESILQKEIHMCDFLFGRQVLKEVFFLHWSLTWACWLFSMSVVACLQSSAIADET